MSGAAAASVWAGLGKRGDSADCGALLEDEERDEFQHRVVPAATTAAKTESPFTARRAAGTGTSHDAPAASTASKESTMAAEPAKDPRNLQRRLGAALSAAGAPMTRAEIAKALPDLSSKQLSQCLFQITGNGRARRFEGVDGKMFELTARGRKWIHHVDPEAPAPARAPTKVPAKAKAKVKPKAKRGHGRPPTVAAKRAKPGRKARQARDGASVPPLEHPAAIAVKPPPLSRTFRVGLYNDGAYHLSKGGVHIDLTLDETRDMFAYLDRIRVDDATA